MALPPEFLASPMLELLAGRVVTIPFDGSAIVEGTVCPTITSSPDDVVRSILAAELEKKKFEIRTSKSTNLAKYSILSKLVTCLLLVACEEPRRYLTVDWVPFGCPAWVSVLGLGLCPHQSLLQLPLHLHNQDQILVLSMQISRRKFLDLVDNERALGKKIKRTIKCLAMEDFS